MRDTTIICRSTKRNETMIEPEVEITDEEAVLDTGVLKVRVDRKISAIHLKQMEKC